MDGMILAIVVALIVLLIVVYSKPQGVERLATYQMNVGTPEEQPASPGESYVKLFEAFNGTHKVFEKRAKSNESVYYRILMPINLKHIDINLLSNDDVENPMPNGASRGVSIWSVYPGDPTASTEATGIYMDTYDDPAFAFRANSPKYQHVLTVKPGTHATLDLEVPVKRIFMVINM